MSAESLLLVEDDRGVREALGRALELEGFDVSTAADGLVALEMIVVRSPDAIILDVMMPRLDGLEVARRVRARGDTTPILMLTARHEVSSRVEGLDAGADDYLVKPFALDELLARIRALLRRGGLSGQGERLRMADLSLDPAARRVFRGNREIEFTKTEFDLLELLLFNARIVLPRDMIMDRIWGFDFVTSSNPLEVYIGYLRRKLEAAGEPRLIHTVRVRGLRGEGTLSLRRRWALGLGVVAALAIGLTTLAAIVSAERQLRGAVDADLHERAAEVNRRAETLLTEGRNLPRRLPPRIVDFDAVVQAFDTTGAAVLRIGQEGAIPPVEAADLAILAGDSRSSIRDVRIGGVPYRMITIRVQRPAGDRPALLAFQIATDLSRVDANLRALSRRLVTIGLIGVLLVGFTGWVLASRAVRPISDLTDAAEQIASKERLDAGGQLDIAAPGAISRLAGAFSSMLASLSASRREQQRLVSDASHEFRTPITALKTNLEILRRQGDGLSVEQRRELIDAALAESDQPADLATELVDLASDVHHTDGRSWR